MRIRLSEQSTEVLRLRGSPFHQDELTKIPRSPQSDTAEMQALGWHETLKQTRNWFCLIKVVTYNYVLKKH